jgi:hypothetical protein
LLGNKIGAVQGMELDQVIRPMVERGFCQVAVIFLPDTIRQTTPPDWLAGQPRVDFRKTIPEPMRHLVDIVIQKPPFPR